MNWYKRAQFGSRFQWVTPIIFDPSKETVVTLDVDKLDRLWQESPFYVGQRASDAGVPGKYEYWQHRLDVGKFNNAEMSKINVSEMNGKPLIVFLEGRHRFSVARDNGEKQVPVVINKDKVEELKKLL